MRSEKSTAELRELKCNDTRWRWPGLAYIDHGRPGGSVEPCAVGVRVRLETAGGGRRPRSRRRHAPHAARALARGTPSRTRLPAPRGVDVVRRPAVHHVHVVGGPGLRDPGFRRLVQHAYRVVRRVALRDGGLQAASQLAQMLRQGRRGDVWDWLVLRLSLSTSPTLEIGADQVEEAAHVTGREIAAVLL